MSSLDERYGTRKPVRRTWWIVGFLAALVVALSWMVWVNFGDTKIGTLDVTHSFDASRNEMSVTWNLTVAPGTPVACAVQALNEQFQVVGWKVVDIPVSDQYNRQFTETFRTVMTPNTGLVYACWAS